MNNLPVDKLLRECYIVIDDKDQDISRNWWLRAKLAAWWFITKPLLYVLEHL